VTKSPARGGPVECEDLRVAVLHDDRCAQERGELAQREWNATCLKGAGLNDPYPSGVAIVTVESTIAAATIARIADDSLSRGGHPR